MEACKTPAKGRALSPENELAKLRFSVVRLERECARYAALARMSQRAVNLAPPAPLGKSTNGAKKVRRRHPVRAMKLAGLLRKDAAEGSPQENAPAPATTATAAELPYKGGTGG